MPTTRLIVLLFIALNSMAENPAKKTSSANPQKKEASKKEPAETVCQYAARLGKNEFLKQIKITKVPTYESELRKMFSVDSFSEVDKLFSLVGTDAIDLTKIDLDKDGTTDYLLHRKEGSIHCGAVAVLLGKKDYQITIAGVPDFNTCELNTGVYTHKDKNYLIFSTNNELSIQEVKARKLAELCVL